MTDWKDLIPSPKTKFVMVKCTCGNEQVIFNSASSKVKCLKCDTILAEPGASKARIKAKILKEFY